MPPMAVSPSVGMRPPDQAGSVETRSPESFEQGDDVASSARPTSDLRAPDLPAPDLPAPDLPAPDLPAPDLPAPDRDDWCALTEHVLPVGGVYDWAVRPDCGAVVLFSGTVRDHADGRPGVSLLEYEAYEGQVIPRLEAIIATARGRWPIGRMALLHRVGPLQLGESSVLVAVSSAHRGEAFDAARFGIDALKACVPIWKKEHWDGGVDWGLAATDITEAEAVATPSERVPRSDDVTKQSEGATLE